MERQFHAVCAVYAGPVIPRSTTSIAMTAASASVAERLMAAGSTLTAAERRVAEVFLEGGDVVAFGTVASVAQAAGAGAATVVRTASKLGFDGFSELQTLVRRQFRSARDTEAEPAGAPEVSGGDVMAGVLDAASTDLRRTFRDLDRAAIDAVADDLADLRHSVVVIGGEVGAMVAAQLVRDVGVLRPGVVSLVGGPTAVEAVLALQQAGDLLIVVDLGRTERWLAEMVDRSRAQGWRTVVLTDRAWSALAGGAEHRLVVSASASGPFTSRVAAVAVAELVVAATAQRLRRVALDRLGRAEAAWQRANSFVGL